MSETNLDLEAKLHRYFKARRLKYRQQLSDLASRRDQIVHKGHDIDQQAAGELIRAARSFISHYARELLDLDLFQ